MGMPCGRDRAKNCYGRTPGDLPSSQQLADRRVVRTAYHKIRDLDGKMQIADVPGENSRPARIAAQLDLKNRLGSLRDHVALSALPVKSGSVPQGVGDIKAELPSIPRYTPPATLCQRHTIRGQYDDLFIGTGLMLTS